MDLVRGSSSVNHSVMSDSLRPHGLKPTRFLCRWNSPGKSTGVECHRLLHKEYLAVQKATFSTCIIPVVMWKILKEMGIPDHLTCLLRNLYVGQEATVRIGHGTTDWFQIGKGLCQGCILSPCLSKLYAGYIIQNGRLEHKLDSRLPGEISVTSDIRMTPPLGQKVKRNSKAS